MKATNLTAQNLVLKTTQQLLEIAESLDLTITADMEDSQIISLILDFNEADDDSIIDVTDNEPEKIPSCYTFSTWDENDEEEVVYARKPVLRPLTAEESLAVKMKRLEMIAKDNSLLEDPKNIYKKLIIIEKVMQERQKAIECISNKMEEEAYIF